MRNFTSLIFICLAFATLAANASSDETFSAAEEEMTLAEMEELYGTPAEEEDDEEDRALGGNDPKWNKYAQRLLK